MVAGANGIWYKGAMKTIEQMKADIDNLSHIQMCRLVRFAPSGHPYFMRNTEVSDYFFDKYNKLGGMTPAISKLIGWA